MSVTAENIKALAQECGFELAGITTASPHEDFTRFEEWRSAGYAGEMSYLTDRRGDLRADPRSLLPDAQSIVCVGKLYNNGQPGTDFNPERGWISRYAWGRDYHHVLRHGLEQLVCRIEALHGEPFQWRICVDTAPILERSYARQAGLGWTGKNTCLINQQRGSWFFLGELLLSIPLAADSPPPDRCGTCTRCIDACPTAAIVPDHSGGWTLDSRLCISYLTIEKRGDLPDPAAIGNHVFGCDICQDVCPWNRRAPVTTDDNFAAQARPTSLQELAELTPDDFRILFRHSAVWRTKYEGFLRNVAAAIGNCSKSEMIRPLQKLAEHPNESVANTARRALEIRDRRPAAF